MPEPNVSEIPAEEAKASSENVSSGGSADSISALTVERDKLAADKAELQDLLLRRQADFDNYRRRTDRERSDFAQYAGSEIVREVLPVVDDFERALKADPASKEYAKGIEMIYQRLLDNLKKAGLEPIDTKEKTFDPHVHQAVEKVQTEDAEDHSILGEFQRGYNFKGKLLRPSMVKVAVRP